MLVGFWPLFSFVSGVLAIILICYCGFVHYSHLLVGFWPLFSFVSGVLPGWCVFLCVFSSGNVFRVGLCPGFIISDSKINVLLLAVLNALMQEWGAIPNDVIRCLTISADASTTAHLHVTHSIQWWH